MLRARGAVGGSVPCSRAPHRGIEGGERAVFTPPTDNLSAGLRLEAATFGLQVRLSNQ